MSNNHLTRKDFLKYLSGLFIIAVGNRAKNFFSFGRTKPSPSIREAKYYSRADHLAG